MQTFDDLAPPLSAVTFVVVDLETTGGSPAAAGITEIGAVKVRGGEVLGEFRTFCDPGEAIPPFIQALTGITPRDLVDAPPVATAVAMFFEFAGWFGEELPILVAHNAAYDVGFLKGACQRHGIPWPAPRVLDTVSLARRVLSSGEVRNRKLGTLAAHFGTEVEPNHRALQDARATVGVLHGLIERVGNLGVHDLAELQTFTTADTERRRRKRHLAQELPDGPGVYIFRGHNDAALYVGKSVDIKQRVRSYFTAAETRGRMTQMVELAERIDAIQCSTPLEAAVRELRLIAALDPRFNRKSRRPQNTTWLTLTEERFPRLSTIHRSVLPPGLAIGPFAGRQAATEAATAIYEVTGLRQCVQRLNSSPTGQSCVLADLHRCSAPCLPGDRENDYAPARSQTEALLAGQLPNWPAALQKRMGQLAATERYEEAAELRNRIDAAARGIHRASSIRALMSAAQVVAVAPRALGWDIQVFRWGALAGSAHATTGVDAKAIAAATVQVAAHIEPNTVHYGEVELNLNWLATARLVESDWTWQLPLWANPQASSAKRWDTAAHRVSAWAADPLSIAAKAAGSAA